MDIEKYRKMLASHDWYSAFSDDHSVWQNGEISMARLIKIAQDGSDDHKRAYNDEHARRFNHASFVLPSTGYRKPFNV